MCFGCSKEPSHWDGSFEYPQHMFWLRKKKSFFSYALWSGLLLFKHTHGGTWGPYPPPPEKSQKYSFFKHVWSRSPEKLRSYRASIQCWVVTSTPAERHLNGVSLAGRWWSAYSGTWIQCTPSPHQRKKKSCQSWTLLDPRMILCY